MTVSVFPCYLRGTRIGKGWWLRATHTVWGFISPHGWPLQPLATGPTTQTKKVDLIPVSCRWPFGLAGPDLHIFPPFSHNEHPPTLPSLSLVFPGSLCGGNPQLKQGLLQGGGGTLQPGPVTLLSEPQRDEARAPERRLWGRLPVRGWERDQTLGGGKQDANFWFGDTFFSPLRTGEADRSCVSPAKKNKSPPESLNPFGKKETPQWIKMLCWTTSIRTWSLYLLLFRPSKNTFYHLYRFRLEPKFLLLCFISLENFTLLT